MSERAKNTDKYNRTTSQRKAALRRKPVLIRKILTRIKAKQKRTNGIQKKTPLIEGEKFCKKSKSLLPV